MVELSIHRCTCAPQSDPFEDLAAARRYLREIAAAAKEGAESPNPQVTALALQLIWPAVRARRGGEVFALVCSSCRHPIEIATKPPHRCSYCGQALAIEWGKEH